MEFYDTIFTTLCVVKLKVRKEESLELRFRLAQKEKREQFQEKFLVFLGGYIQPGRVAASGEGDWGLGVGRTLLTLHPLVWWEFVIICISYFFYGKISFEKSLRQIARQQSAGSSGLLHCSRWITGGKPSPWQVGQPPHPHTIHTAHTFLLPVSPKRWPIPKHGLPPAPGEDSQNNPASHSWVGKRSCSCPVPHGRRRHEPLKARKVLSPKCHSLCFPGGTRSILAPLLAPRTVQATFTTEGTHSDNCPGRLLSKPLPRTAFSEVSLYSIYHHHRCHHHHHQSLLSLSEKPGQVLDLWLVDWVKGVTVGCGDTSTQSQAPMEPVV